MTKVLAPLILLICVAVFSSAFFATKKANNQPQSKVSNNQGVQQNTQGQIVYYYGQECPHCAKVEKFIKENNVHDKVSFEEKEVWHNRSNAAELEEKAKKCGIPISEVGVPFLWDGQKCLIGEVEVINFFKSKMGPS